MVLVEMEKKRMPVSGGRKTCVLIVSQDSYNSFLFRLLKNSLLPTEERLHAE